MKTFALLLSLFISVALLPAQTSKGYEEGLIVTNAGDTVRGEIKHKSGETIKDRIYLKLSEEEKRTYKASEISYFRAGEEGFITQNIDGESVFLREWAIGYLELYEQQIVDESSSVEAHSYQPYIRKAGEKDLVPIKLNAWKKQVLSYIADYPGLVADVEKNKYKLEDLGKVIQLYNEWKDAE